MPNRGPGKSPWGEVQFCGALSICIRGMNVILSADRREESLRFDGFKGFIIGILRFAQDDIN